MDVVVPSEHHLVRFPDGSIRSMKGTKDRTFWERYVRVFSAVTVVSRVRTASDISMDGSTAEGPGIHFTELPDYRGPLGFVKQCWRLNQIIRSVSRTHSRSAFVLRAPGTIGYLLALHLRRTGHPFALEVVGDPYDVFAPGAVRSPVRPLIRLIFPAMLRHLAKRAVAVSYVTEKALQARYPAGPEAFTTHYSSVQLTEEWFRSEPRCYPRPLSRVRLISIGMFDQLYKAQDVLVDAVARCTAAGLDVRLCLIGDGAYRSQIEAQVAQLGIEDRVRFAGLVTSREEVRRLLDEADLFVLPSRQEGLPRAMIEAMARALPCIGSTVGGFSELVPDEDLIPPDDVDALAARIRAVVDDPDRMERMSARNLTKARDYSDDVLRERRTQFYTYVRDATEQWIGDQ